MAVERLGIKLSEDVDLINLAVYAVAHRDIDQPVTSPNRHLTPTEDYPITNVTFSRFNQWHVLQRESPIVTHHSCNAEQIHDEMWLVSD